jgi:positive regulator of sigma E activity
MTYLKYVSYVYLFAAGFFIVDAIMRINSDESPLLSLVLAGISIFMFFFRRRYAKKFEQRNNKP